MITNLQKFKEQLVVENNIPMRMPIVKSNTILVKPDVKDFERIKGIINRANNDREKEEKLAINMANAITDGPKAMARAKAAAQLKYPNISRIFVRRAKALGLNEDFSSDTNNLNVGNVVDYHGLSAIVHSVNSPEFGVNIKIMDTDEIKMYVPLDEVDFLRVSESLK